MVSLTLILITAAIITIFYFLLNGESERRRKNLPPGPRGIPILGSLLSLGHRPYIQFGKWVQDYGEVMMVNLLNLKLVVISDVKVGREAYNNPALTGKPDLELFKQFSGGDFGILSTQGRGWVEQRRFTLRHLRDFGFGKSSMESLIMDEVNEFMEWVKAQEGKSISLNRKFTLAVVNSLCMILNGKRYKQTDEKLNNLLETMIKAFTSTSESPCALFVPNFAKLLPTLTGWTKMVRAVAAFQIFMKEGIEENKIGFSPNETRRHFTDTYMQTMFDSTDRKSTFYKELGEKNLLATVGDLFAAGSETTSQTLAWAFLYLTTYPKIQVRIQEEIGSVVDKTRRVNLEDRKDLPFVHAVILETLRWSSLTPLGIFHCAMEDTRLGKFNIPKGTLISINQHYIHHDKSIWGDPENFRPERFLSPDGKKLVNTEYLIPFSLGRRTCVGEPLARDEIFLFLTNILQKFNVKLDSSRGKASLEPESTLFLFPQTFHVIMEERVV